VSDYTFSTLIGIDKMFESIILKVGRFVKNQLQTESALFLPHPTKDVKVPWYD